MKEAEEAVMKLNIDIVCQVISLYLIIVGDVTATLTLPCYVNKDTSWDKGYHFNCSYRQLTQVPLDIPVGTTTLLLNNNVISKLGSTAFSNLTELRYLDLSTNVMHSTQIAPDAFSALVSLQYLDLSFNALCMSNECFPQRLYQSLRALRVFKVTTGNNVIPDSRGVIEYPFRSLSVMSQLTEVHISGIRNVAIPLDIEYCKNLQILDLHQGFLENISSKTFRALQNTNVTTLSLRDNQIKHVEMGTFSDLRNLRNLNMACNSDIGYKRMIRVLWATKNSGIDSLIIDKVRHNGEASIVNFNEVCYTPFAKKLRRLSIRCNNIITIDVIYFGKCLPRLQWLNFGYNIVTFFESHGFEQTDVMKLFPPMLVAVDISHTNSLPDVYRIRCCKPHNLPFDDAFRLPTSVMVNNITTEEQNNATLKHRKGAIYLMSSLRYVFADHVSLSTSGYHVKSLSFYPESNIVYFNLSNSKVAKSMDRPWHGMDQLQTVDMSHGVLQYMSADLFMHFDNLRFLNLSDNRLGEISDKHSQDQMAAVYGRVFNCLTLLEELDLSQNSFQMINKNAFVNLTKLRILKLNDNRFKKQFTLNLSNLTSLRYLNLAKNQMSSLSEDLRDTLDQLSERVNFSVDISGNPLSCYSCASLAFLHWLRTTTVSVVAKDMLTCAGYHTLRVLSVSLEDLEAACATPTPGVSFLLMFTITGSVGVCTLTSLLFLYVHRWRIRWYYYSIKRRWQNDTSTHDAGHYRYDACVVYANADLDWVAHELIDQVETDWALSLFVYDRDSMAGCPIAENIVQSLETSKHVLFVLTPDFCREKWCDFALNMALLRDQKSLVMLYVKPIAHDSMSRTLRALVNPRTRCTLVEWGDGEYAQSLFWQRLHDTLLPTTDSDMLLYRIAPCVQRPLLPSE